MFPGGDYPYRNEGDARRLALGVNCRFWTQVTTVPKYCA